MATAIGQASFVATGASDPTKRFPSAHLYATLVNLSVTVVSFAPVVNQRMHSVLA